MRRPGVEPGSTAWKATMLTVTPPTQLLLLVCLHSPHNRLSLTENYRLFQLSTFIYCIKSISVIPSGLVVRIPRSHRGGRGSIPRLGRLLFPFLVELVLATRKIKTQVLPRFELGSQDSES